MIKERIKEFVSRFMRNHDLRYDEDIFSLGFVNSLFAMQLVMFVEREFDFTVENEDLDMDNFRTVEAIAALVGRKKTGVAVGG
jgi:acyl carrier protein